MSPMPAAVSLALTGMLKEIQVCLTKTPAQLMCCSECTDRKEGNK